MFRNALVVALLALVTTNALAEPLPGLQDYQELLDLYVRPIQAKGQPYDSKFDYGQLYVDEKIWTKKTSDRLDRIHAMMFAAQPSRMMPKERLAWALNLYNFSVLERVTRGLLVPKHDFQRYKTVDQIDARRGLFFGTRVLDIDGQSYSLDEFERIFFYGDTAFSHVRRQVGGDPRLQFAICPARIGGPPLLARAFKPESLEIQLDAATRNALALPRFVTLDPSRKTLVLSQWMADRLVDFGDVKGLLEFVRKYGPRPVAEAIKRGQVTGVTRYSAVEKPLNYFERVQTITPGPATNDGGGTK